MNINISEDIYKMHLLLPLTTALGHDGKGKNILGQAALHTAVHSNIDDATSLLEHAKFAGSGYDLLPRKGFRKTVFSNGHFGLRTF